MKLLRFSILTVAVFAAFGANARILNFEGRDATTVGARVVELSTGRVVAEENSDLAMIPASILKSLTTATALSINGSDFRYTTRVVLTGNIVDGKVNGNITIFSSGDPTIDSDAFTEYKGFGDSIVSNLRRLGVNTIVGDIIIDESNFSESGPNPQWAIGDVGWSYGAAPFGFNWCDNTFRLYTATMRTVPEVPYIDVVLEPNNQSIDVTRGVNSDIYVVSGRDLNKPETFVNTTMNSPSSAFAYNLKNLLEQKGIMVMDQVVAPSNVNVPVYTHRSPANIDILRSLMFRSDNMMAEATLRSIAPGQSRSKAITRETSLWNDKGVSTSHIKIFDGSGLARADRVTPRFMCDVLINMANSTKGEDYVSLFPKVGQQGTVKSFLKQTSLKGKLALKSGSINGVHCYAGYKLDTQGRPTHAVVIMVNNFFCPRDTVRRAIEQWFITTFR